MKKSIILFLIIFNLNAVNLTADIKNSFDIYVPRTLSSIPVMELDKTEINNSKINIQFFDDHILAMAEFINGKYPVLMTGFSQGLIHYRSSKDIIMIATPVWGVSSLITNNPELTELSDFAGKTILVPFAKSPLELQLIAILKNENLSGIVKIDYAPVQQQVPLLLVKKADGICIPEPLASKLILEKKGYEVFSFAGKWSKMNNGDARSPQVSLFAKKDYAESNNKLLLDLIIELNKKIDYIIRNPQIISLKYSVIFKLDKSIIENGVKKVVFDLPDSKTESELCGKYEKLIGDMADIDEAFFFNHK